jgi:hypothetical protein
VEHIYYILLFKLFLWLLYKVFSYRKEGNLDTYVSYLEQKNQILEEKQNEIESRYADKEDAARFLLQMDSLGYFKYTDSRDIDSVAEYILQSYSLDYFGMTYIDEDTNVFLDRRYYFCDAADVYKRRGIYDMIHEMRPTFDRMDATVKINDYVEDYDEKGDYAILSITINQVYYLITDGSKDYFWAQAVLRLAEIVNDVLARQHIDEQIYLIGIGNDGGLVFLNKALYRYLNRLYRESNERPMNSHDWGKRYIFDIQSNQEAQDKDIDSSRLN